MLSSLHANNEIVYLLLSKYTANLNLPVNLLNMGTSHMAAWKACGLKNVVSLSLSKSDAHNAIADFKRLQYAHFVRYTFYYTTPEKDFTMFLRSRNISEVHDIVCCTKTLHVFAKDIQMLRLFVSRISKCMNDRGYFIGTFKNGNKIAELLASKSQIYSGSMMIHKKYEHVKQIGDEVKVVEIASLLCGDRVYNAEFLVFKETLEKVCNESGLYLIEFVDFSDYCKSSKLNNSTDYCKSACSLLTTFAFQKRVA